MLPLPFSGEPANLDRLAPASLPCAALLAPRFLHALSRAVSTITVRCSPPPPHVEVPTRLWPRPSPSVLSTSTSTSSFASPCHSSPVRRTQMDAHAVPVAPFFSWSCSWSCTWLQELRLPKTCKPSLSPVFGDPSQLPMLLKKPKTKTKLRKEPLVPDCRSSHLVVVGVNQTRQTGTLAPNNAIDGLPLLASSRLVVMWSAPPAKLRPRQMPLGLSTAWSSSQIVAAPRQRNEEARWKRNASSHQCIVRSLHAAARLQPPNDQPVVIYQSPPTDGSWAG